MLAWTNWRTCCCAWRSDSFLARITLRVCKSFWLGRLPGMQARRHRHRPIASERLQGPRAGASRRPSNRGPLHYE
jgi:hypothetical protein